MGGLNRYFNEITCSKIVDFGGILSKMKWSGGLIFSGGVVVVGGLT